jgi:hypothetical protein
MEKGKFLTLPGLKSNSVARRYIDYRGPKCKAILTFTTCIFLGHAATLFLRSYAESRKVADSVPYEVTGFFLISLILSAAPWPGDLLRL